MRGFFTAPFAEFFQLNFALYFALVFAWPVIDALTGGAGEFYEAILGHMSVYEKVKPNLN